MSSRRRRLAALGAAAVGTVAAAAVAGAVAERKLVGRRRTGEEGDDFGALRSDPVVVETEDGVRLHAEVDEADPDIAAGAPGASVEPTLVFVHGYALNLDCWHFQRAHFRGRRRMVFYDQRSHGRSGRSTKHHATIEQLGRDLKTVLDELVPDGPVVLVGHSMGGMTVMALAEQEPELFGERVVGVGLISTAAGGLRTHKVLHPLLPDRIMRQITPRAMALLARAPGLVDGARRTGSDVGFLVTGKFAFGTEVPASYVEFVDEMLSSTPFEVVAEFFSNFARLDKFETVKALGIVPGSSVRAASRSPAYPRSRATRSAVPTSAPATPIRWASGCTATRRRPSRSPPVSRSSAPTGRPPASASSPPWSARTRATLSSVSSVAVEGGSSGVRAPKPAWITDTTSAARPAPTSCTATAPLTRGPASVSGPPTRSSYRSVRPVMPTASRAGGRRPRRPSAPGRS